MQAITSQQFDRYAKVQKNCNHRDMVEVVNGYRCCFCTKLMNVISINAGCTTAEFSEQYKEYAYQNIDWAEVERLTKDILQKRGFANA